MEQNEENKTIEEAMVDLPIEDDSPLPIPEGDDDGSLAFLQIQSDPQRRQFNCPEITQQKLVNTTFWVDDYYKDIKTKFGLRYLVKIKPTKDAPDSEAKKFFTNCEDIKYVLRQIDRMNAFPRRVTLRANGNRYFFE